MAIKPGGGNKMQPYDKTNGEYVNEQCEKDKEDVIINYLFGFDRSAPVVYPTKGIHDEEYCGCVLDNVVDKHNPIVDTRKVTDYLLVFKEDSDKSKYFKLLGYDMNNWEKLYDQIKSGVNFQVRRFEFGTYCCKIVAEHKILNLNNGRYYTIHSVWELQKDFKVKFITFNIGERRNKNV